ncbi:MAG: WD40 repeat domain-containing protein [Bacteroidota bacterium]|nr:WD40 repeat domain-containing protein [Bacteroidota bacterium]
MTKLRNILPLLLVAVAFSACSEDDPATMTHYFNPVWTPDGSTIVAGFVQEGTGLVSDVAPVSANWGDLAVMDFSSRTLRTVSMPDVATVHALYSFDPSGTALAFVQEGHIRFYDLNGSLLLDYLPAEGGSPVLMDFSNTGNSFVWIGGAVGDYSLNLTTYDAASWTVETEFTMADIESGSAVIALTLTGQRSAAVRYDDGTVREYDFNADLLNTFTTTPFTSPNPWQQRLMYVSGNQGRRLFARDAGGLHRFDLDAGAARQLVFGSVVDMDVSGSRGSMVYETGTGDTWIATMEGTPLTRIGPQNIMPRFSPADNGIASVERLDVFTDSLHVFVLK